jgi:hypothetical protein
LLILEQVGSGHAVNDRDTFRSTLGANGHSLRLSCQATTCDEFAPSGTRGSSRSVAWRGGTAKLRASP